MEFVSPPTEKGARQAEEIVEAALRCLARDGFAATSLGRVAEEAGVSKRMVLYYFDSRAALFDRIAVAVGDRMLAQLREAMAGIRDPDEVVNAGFGSVWGAITADRGLVVALFGILTEAVTNEQLGRTIGVMKEQIRDALRKQLTDARAGGRRTIIDDDVAVELMLSGFLGLAVEWLEIGDTPALIGAIDNYQAAIAAITPPA